MNNVEKRLAPLVSGKSSCTTGGSQAAISYISPKVFVIEFYFHANTSAEVIVARGPPAACHLVCVSLLSLKYLLIVSSSLAVKTNSQNNFKESDS